MIGFLKLKLKSKLFLTGLAIVLIIIGTVIFRANSKNGIETIHPEIGNLVRTVSVSGKIVAAKNVDLAFDTSGIVSRVHKSVGDSVIAGDVIAEFDRSELEADRLKAQADLEAAEAELGKIQSTGEETDVTNAKRAVVQSIVDAYTVSDDAIHNKVDQFFDYPRSPIPDLIPWLEDRDLEKEINKTRIDIEDLLKAWKGRTLNLNVSTYTDADLKTSQTNISSILVFLDDVARALGMVEVTEELSQTKIDKYRTDVAVARTSVSGVASDLVAKGNTLEGVVSNTPVLSANVRSAEASLARIEAGIKKTILRSPISGIVSIQDAKVGESVQANKAIASVISTTYEIEAFVPEVSIAGIEVGNVARVTLDAYGQGVEFGARIAHIDPAETIRDGVSMYKIKLIFDKNDSRVKSGMTANTTIETFKKENVLLIPLRLVLQKEDGTNSVFVKVGENFVETNIEIGEVDSRGNAEVTSGLSLDDTLRLEPLIVKK